MFGIRLSYKDLPLDLVKAHYFSMPGIIGNVITVHHTLIENISKLYFDVGFQSTDQAKYAATLTFETPAGRLEVCHTRSDQDRSFWVTFSDLPTVPTPEDLQTDLIKGLEAYGQVAEFHMVAPHYYAAHQQCRTAQARLIPTESVNKIWIKSLGWPN